MKKPKRYEIETIQQLVNVSNVENFERLSVDFLLWLNYLNHIKAKQDIEVEKFIWIDDGKNELKKTQITNKKTGEVTTLWNHK